MLTLPFPSPDHHAIRTARLRGDGALDDRGFACASGMFCRLTCTRATAAEVLVRPTVADCVRAGLRPCPACRPLGVAGDRDASIARLLAAREDRPLHRWSARDVSALGCDPAAVARAFRRHMGLGFLELARILRADAHDGAGRPDDAGVPATAAARDAVERLLHEGGPAGAAGASLAACWIGTPVGTMLAVSDDTRLHLLEFHDRTRLPGQIARLRREIGARIVMRAAARTALGLPNRVASAP